MRFVLFFLLFFTLIACTEIVSTQDTTFSYRGDTFRAEIREYSTGSSTFTKRVVYDGRTPVSCSATDDLDCAAAISYERLDSND